MAFQRRNHFQKLFRSSTTLHRTVDDTLNDPVFINHIVIELFAPVTISQGSFGWCIKGQRKVGLGFILNPLEAVESLFFFTKDCDDFNTFFFKLLACITLQLTELSHAKRSPVGT